MKKSEANVTQGELAKSQQSAGNKLEAPVQLTPAQLEMVAAGFMAQISQVKGGIGSTATTGLYPTKDPVVASFLKAAVN